jgi:hypothetical protein
VTGTPPPYVEVRVGAVGVAPVRISRRVPRGVGEISGGEVAGVSSRLWVDNGRRGGAGGGDSEEGTTEQQRKRQSREGKRRTTGCTITLTCDQTRLRATLPYIDTEVSSYFNGTR